METKNVSRLLQTEFNKQLSDIRLVIEKPIVYLSNYFIDLRNQVDVLFVDYIQTKQSCKERLNKDWSTIISKIYQLEKEFTSSLLVFDAELKKEMDVIEKNVYKLNNNYDLNLFQTVKKMVDKLEFKIQRNLFSNKTIVLLIREYPSLLIIKNSYIGSKVVQCLKNSSIKYI